MHNKLLIRGKMNKTFEDYLNIYKKDISGICKSFCNEIGNPKIEYEDLFQIASIKLWQLFKDYRKEINTKQYVVKSIRLELGKHILAEFKNPLTTAICLDAILEQQENFI